MRRKIYIDHKLVGKSLRSRPITLNINGNFDETKVVKSKIRLATKWQLTYDASESNRVRRIRQIHKIYISVLTRWFKTGRHLTRVQQKEKLAKRKIWYWSLKRWWLGWYRLVSRKQGWPQAVRVRRSIRRSITRIDCATGPHGVMYVSLDSPERAFECIDRGKFAYTTYLHENLRTRRKIRTFLATWPDQSWRRSLARWKIKRERAHCTPLYPYFIPSSHFPSLSVSLYFVPPPPLFLKSRPFVYTCTKEQSFRTALFHWRMKIEEKHKQTVGNSRTVVEQITHTDHIYRIDVCWVFDRTNKNEARRKARNGATRCTCQLPLHA